jgi:hypothetical protein
VKFNKQHKVIINTLSKDEATAFISFLNSEIIRHWDDIKQASDLIGTVAEKFNIEIKIEEYKDKWHLSI